MSLSYGKENEALDVEKGSGPLTPDESRPTSLQVEDGASAGVWSKFDRYNRKLEHKLGIETVSGLLLANKKVAKSAEGYRASS